MMLGYLWLDPGEVRGRSRNPEEPVFQLPALWIQEKKKEDAQFAGYTVVDISTIIATHLTEILKSHADELLGRQDVQKLLDRLAENYPKVVEELIPNLLSLGVIQKVLQNLLKERVTMRDLLTIVEALADYAPVTKDPEVLTEYVRQRLARSIVKQYETPEGVLPLITIDQQMEDLLRDKVQRSDYGSYLSLDPGLAQKILTSIHQPSTKSLISTITDTLCSPLLSDISEISAFSASGGGFVA
jgi:flagellar biosynthesis protein FlhA